MMKIQWMLFIIGLTAASSFIFTSCEKATMEEPVALVQQFVGLESPYLICASRNPGGIGFEFVYKGQKGGANNLDSLSVSDFSYDLKVRTIKGEKPDGTLGGVPFIQLYEQVDAVNYSAVDTTCMGYVAFQALNVTTVKPYTLVADNPVFELTSVPAGSTGSPLMEPLLQEFSKLVMGQRWKESAGNDIPDDEQIWLIKTREGRMVKFIVTDFPASPAPTATGYIAIVWDYLE